MYFEYQQQAYYQGRQSYLPLIDLCFFIPTMNTIPMLKYCNSCVNRKFKGSCVSRAMCWLVSLEFRDCYGNVRNLLNTFNRGMYPAASWLTIITRQPHLLQQFTTMDKLFAVNYCYCVYLKTEYFMYLSFRKKGCWSFRWKFYTVTNAMKTAFIYLMIMILWRCLHRSCNSFLA